MRVHVVLGGSSGIGRAVAERLAADGDAVVLGARGAERGEAVAAGIRARGGTARFVRADATVEGDVAGLVAAAVDAFGRLDGAFNNAGGVLAAGALRELDTAAWRAELDANLTSVFLALKHELPALLAGGSGAVVNNAAFAGVRGVPGMAAYTAAKHGVVGLTRAAALEHAADGVRVNALVTGTVDTPLLRRLLGAPPDAALDGAGFNPQGRLAAPDEIAALVAYLLSDGARFITGAAIPIDGGATAG